MTTVYYFGKESCCPKTELEKEDDKLKLKKVVFESYYENSMIIEESQNQILIPKPYYFKSVVCGNSFACLLDEKNELWSFGSGFYGQLGNNKIVNKQDFPINTSVSCQTKFTKVSCGDTHVIAFGNDKKLYCWGDTMYGKITYTDSKLISIAKEIPKTKFIDHKNINETTTKDKLKKSHEESTIKTKKEIAAQIKLQAELIKFQDIVCGPQHTFVLIDGKIFCFGKQSMGQLGIGSSTKSDFYKNPTPISYFNNLKIAGIAAGSKHTIAWDTDGTIYSWGDSTDGKLGYPVTMQSQNQEESFPKKITLLDHYKIISGACGDNYSLALTNEGEVYAWGRGSFTTISKNSEKSINLIDAMRPKKLLFKQYNEKKIKIIKLCCGNTHYVVIDQNGAAFSWGDCSEGALGLKTYEDIYNPTYIQILGKKRVIDVGCGEKFTVFLTDNWNPNIPNLNLAFYQNQRKLHLKKKLDSLINFSKRKSIMANNIENSKKEDGLGTFSSFKALSNQPTMNKIHKKSKNTDLSRKDLYNIGEGILIQLENTHKETKNILNNGNSKKKNFFGYDPDANLIKINEFESNQFDHNKDKAYDSFKTFKEIEEIEDDIPNIKQNLIDNINKFETKDSIKYYSNSNLELIYDNVAEEMINKEKKNPLFIPIDIIENQILDSDDEEEKQKLTYEGKKMILEELKKSTIKPRSDRVIRQQNLLVNTEKDVLKYEYFQTIKHGLEQEHLSYLLTNPKIIQSNTNEEKQIKKHERDEKNFEIFNDQTSENVKSIQNQLKNNNLNFIYNELNEEYNKTNKLIFNYVTFFNKTKQNSTKNEIDNHLERILSAEKYKTQIMDKMKKNSKKRNYRIRKANDLKRKLVMSRKKEIEEKIEKKSIEYKQKLEITNIKKTEYIKKKKSMMKILNAQLFIDLIFNISEKMLEYKRKMFNLNMKAQLIQKSIRQYLISKKIVSFENPTSKKAFKSLIHVFRIRRRINIKKKSASKIRITILMKNFKNQLVYKLKIFRKAVFFIQKFCLWLDSLKTIENLKLITQFDDHLKQIYRSGKGTKIPNSPNSYKSSLKVRKRSSLTTEEKDIQFDQILSYNEFIAINKFIESQNDIISKREINKHEIIEQIKELLTIEDENNEIIKNMKNIEEQLNFALENQKILSLNKILKLKLFESFLPYTKDKDKCIIPKTLQIKFEKPSIHENIKYRLMIDEFLIKYDKLDQYRIIQNKKYRSLLKDYFIELNNFAFQKKDEINLERAKMMLRTNVTELKKIQRREENILLNALKRKNIENPETKFDHLPFYNKILIIASQIPNHPKKPKKKMIINNESYKHLLSNFFDSLRKKYIKLCFSRNFKKKERKTITNETTDPFSINSPKLSEQTPIK